MKLSITDFPPVLYAEMYGYYEGMINRYTCKTEQGWRLDVSFTTNSGYSNSRKRQGTDYSYASVSVTSPSGRCFHRCYYFAGTQSQDLKALSEKFFNEYEIWPLGLYNSEVSWGRIKEA